MKIKFTSDDNSPLKQKLKFDNIKLFLDECLYKLAE